MTNPPRVSVVMPIYNAEKYLREAVDSILQQSFTDFELLVYDNKSTDDTHLILSTYKDPRMRVTVNDKTYTTTYSANRGLDEAQGEYIAIMHGDDISLPNRLAEQVALLDAHCELGLCGTWIESIGIASGTEKLPTDPEEIRCRLLFKSVIMHPTVMFRKSLLNAHSLRFDIYAAEDLHLWRESSDIFPISNVPKVLFQYRVHANSFTQLNMGAKLNMARFEIDRLRLNKLGIDPTQDELTLHLWLETPSGEWRLNEAEQWMLKLRAGNKATGLYNEEVLDRDLARTWARLCRHAPIPPAKRVTRFAKSPLLRLSTLPLQERMMRVAAIQGVLCLAPLRDIARKTLKRSQ